jgi:hypothetical protein
MRHGLVDPVRLDWLGGHRLSRMYSNYPITMREWLGEDRWRSRGHGPSSGAAAVCSDDTWK